MAGFKLPTIAIVLITILSALSLVGCTTSPQNTLTDGRNTTQTSLGTGTPSTTPMTAFNMTIAHAMQDLHRQGAQVPLMAPTEPAQMAVSMRVYLGRETQPAASIGTNVFKINTIHFSNDVTQAMKLVRQSTKMPYLFAPTEPNFNPHSTYIGVRASASEWAYNVRLNSTSTSVPFNDPNLDHLSAVSMVGFFGGTEYASHVNAMNAFHANFAVHKIQSTETNVDFMKLYKTGVPMSYRLQQSVYEWQEGKWTIDVFGADSMDLQSMAKRVATFLQYALPPTDGQILVNPQTTGTPLTQIGWVFGNTLYECASPSLMNALQMAVSMREYDTYQVTP